MSAILGLIHRSFDYLSLHLLRRIEIRYRLINSFILLSLLPLLISGYIAYVESIGAIEEKTRIFSTEVVKQVSKNVTLRMAQIDSESATLVLSDRVQRALTLFADGNESARAAARLDLTQILIDRYGSLDYVNQKYFLDRGNHIIDTQMFAQLTRGVVRFVDRAADPHGQPHWGSYDNGIGQQNLGMVRTIINKSNNKLIGSIFLAIRPEHFSAIFDNVDLGSGADIFILDAESGKVVAWPQGRPARVDDQASAAPLVAKIAECLQRKEWNGFIKFADTKQDKYLAAYAPIPGTTWLVINTIPESRLTAEVQSVRNKMLLIGFLGLLFSIAMAAIISRSISAPLKELMGKMRASGNLVNQTPAEQGSSYPADMKGQDELSRLAYSFAGLSDAVNQKIHEINDINASLENKVRERTTALAASEQESRTLIENSPDTIARYDLQCRRIYVNPVFGKLTEGGIAALLWKTPSESPGGPNAEIYEAKIKEVIASGENGQFELKWPGKDGKEHCSHIRLTAERDESGRVISILGVGRDITALNHSRSELAEVNAQLESMNARLQSLATSDPLTLLPNRRLLLDRLHKALASGARHARSGAIMFIDLDNFKTLNDTLGHDVGDILLQQVAKRLESCVRETDTVARLGGDEFVVMLEDLSGQVIEAAEQTELVGNKILAMFNQPYQLATHEYQNTASIGATLFNDNLQTPDELMKQADIAMYQAKKAGRNTLRFFDPRMQEVVNAHAALENELRKALENRQFHLYYQIQVGELQADGTHRPLGAEALIRWIHPERGVISPAQFIPLAEETGTILLIGQWVLDTACAQLKAWQQDALTRDLVLAVNVSAKQFLQPNFKDQVQAVVQRHAINPRRLKLELTESLFLDNIDNVIVTMNALNEIGILFSLDDFGTGYSSLQYLKRLPLDQLKIDQSFVRDIVSDSSDRAIISTIIAMANSLNLNVIAEGVETAEQLELLLSKGCVHYQGYLFGKPMPIEHFNADTRFVTSS